MAATTIITSPRALLSGLIPLLYQLIYTQCRTNFIPISNTVSLIVKPKNPLCERISTRDEVYNRLGRNWTVLKHPPC